MNRYYTGGARKKKQHKGNIRALTTWQHFLAQYRANHPSIGFRQAQMNASKEWRREHPVTARRKIGTMRRQPSAPPRSSSLPRHVPMNRAEMLARRPVAPRRRRTQHASWDSAEDLANEVHNPLESDSLSEDEFWQPTPRKKKKLPGTHRR